MLKRTGSQILHNHHSTRDSVVLHGGEEERSAAEEPLVGVAIAGHDHAGCKFLPLQACVHGERHHRAPVLLLRKEPDVKLCVDTARLHY